MHHLASARTSRPPSASISGLPSVHAVRVRPQEAADQAGARAFLAGHLRDLDIQVRPPPARLRGGAAGPRGRADGRPRARTGRRRRGGTPRRHGRRRGARIPMAPARGTDEGPARLRVGMGLPRHRQPSIARAIEGCSACILSECVPAMRGTTRQRIRLHGSIRPSNR